MLANAAPANLNTSRDVQNAIDGKKAENRNLEKEKEAADQKVAAIESTLAVLQGELDVHNANLVRLEAELEEAAAAAAAQYETLKKRIRVMYEQGSDNYLDVLLSSGSLTDFLNRFEIIKQIAEYDNNRLNTLRDTMQKIDETARQVETEKTAKEGKMASYQSEKAKLNSEQAKRDAIIDENNADIEELKELYAQKDAQEKAARAAAAARMSQNTKFVGGAMEWPAPGYYNITSHFGYRFHPVLKINRLHAGMDIGAPRGAVIVAANEGTVLTARYSSSYGNHVIIDHGGGVATLYAHGSGIVVTEGQKVTRGQQLMKCDSTGLSTGPHLHFEVIVNGSNVDPASYF
jgi:murein DD-endopeptidase MepM/ murein hydrolase activator NlpD